MISGLSILHRMRNRKWDEQFEAPDEYYLDRCVHCSTIMTVDIRGKFCPECGKKNPTRSELVEQRKQPRCPQCNAEKQLGAFCMECGSKIKGVAPVVSA